MYDKSYQMQKVSYDTTATLSADFSTIFKGIFGSSNINQNRTNHTKIHPFYVYQLNIHFHRLVL
jgi:hypothetical protein